MENVELQPLKSSVKVEEISQHSRDKNRSLVLIKPTEVKQYLYKISYADIEKEPRPLTVGKLDICWRYSMGECGRLQTHPLTQSVSRSKRV